MHHQLLRKLACCMAIFAFCAPNPVMGQCGNTTFALDSDGEGCGSATQSFSISGAPNHDQIRWNWGDGNSRTTQNLSENYSYQSPGNYDPSVEFLDANGDVICEVTLGSTISIYEKPQADFNVVSNQFQCLKGNEFSFQDASSQGDAPITDRSWVFSDGGPHSDTGTSATHSYAQGGTYPVTLQITDSNGCTDFEEKRQAAQVSKAIGAQFSTQYMTASGEPACPQTEVQFTNQTPDQSRIQDYTFIPGDGSGATSFSVPWSTNNHVYKKDGTFQPALIVTDTNGCKDTFSSEVRNINYNFDKNVVTGDSIKCIYANTFNFSHTPRNQANGVTWNFGHQPPPSPAVMNEWQVSHQMGTNPGVFDVLLEIRETRSCVKDTTYQDALAVEGPVAHINHPEAGRFSPVNTYVGPEDKIITKEDFKAINESSCGAQSLQYYNNPDVTENAKTWNRGDPIPGDTVYGPESRTFNYQNVHDTDIYDPTCEAPNLVRFTNNSVKFRLERDANGNVQSPFQAIQYSDDETNTLTSRGNVPNPGGDWASDSLEFFWRFNDPSAAACTTQTVAESQTQQGKRCNFSTARTPYHLFDTAQCFTVGLEVHDTVTGCRDRTTMQIFTTEPKAGWEEAYYQEERQLTYPNYNGADSFAFDSLMNWSSSYNNQSPEELLATRVLKAKGVTITDQTGTSLNPSDYEIVNHDLAWVKFTGSKPSNGALTFQYTAQLPEFFEGNPVSVDRMSYSLQNQLDAKYGPNGGPRRGLRIEGAKCEGVTQEIQQLQGTYPTNQCGKYGKDFGFVRDSASMTSAVTCTDSIDTNNDGQFDDTVKKVKTNASWVSGSQVVANPMAWNWEFEYKEPGCKTPGVWIQTGDCYDTFWYSDYTYILPNDPAYQVLESGTKDPYIDQELNQGFCLGEIGKDSFAFHITPQNTGQEQITNFEAKVTSLEPDISSANYQKALGTDSIVDTIYKFCTDSIVQQPDGEGGTMQVCQGSLINYPQKTCGSNIADRLSLQDMLNSDDYQIFDTMHVVNLEDEETFSIKHPGVYRLSTQVTNAEGCKNQEVGENPLYVGHYSNYEPYVSGNGNDSTVCKGDTVYFRNPDVGSGNHFNYIDHHLPVYFERHEVNFGGQTLFRYLHEGRKFQDPKGGGRQKPAGGYEQVEYDLNGDRYYETRYDIDKLLFVQDQDLDGTYETTLSPRDVDADGQADTVPYFVYEESGTYDIAVKSTDSSGCAQIQRQEEKVVVNKVESFIGLDEEPGACAPQTVQFVDSSVLTNAYRYSYGKSGQIKDSVKVDSITQWEWSIEDRSFFERSPIHTFANNGQFTPQLKVTTAAGCSGVTSQMIRKPDTANEVDTNTTITLAGPKPGFVINDTGNCEVTFKDTSKRVDEWTFFKGNGEQESFTQRPQDSTFALTYEEEGTYCVNVLVESGIPGDTGTCKAYFPGEISGPDTPCVNVDVEGSANVTADFAANFDGLTISLNNLSSNANEWKWYFGDGTTDTVENPEHTFPSKDSFTVCLKAMNGCSSDSTCQSYNLTTLAQAKKEGPQVEIYPNPVTAELNIQYEDFSNDVGFEIFDVTGRKVSYGKIRGQSGVQSVDVEALTPGVYWIRFEASDLQTVKRFVVAE